MSSLLHVPVVQVPLVVLGFAGFGLILDVLTGDELLFDMFFGKNNRDRFAPTSVSHKLRIAGIGLLVVAVCAVLVLGIQALVPA